MKFLYIGVIYFILTISELSSYTNACKGCLRMDEYNFDRIIPSFEAILTKFDVAYPYGKKHEVFTGLAEEIAHVDNRHVILAEVGIKDYGEKDNLEFSKQFGIYDKDDLPALRLFVNGIDKPFVYDKDMPWTIDNIKQFIRNHTDIYLSQVGCLEAFDKLAVKLARSSYKDDVLQETQELAKALKSEREKIIANRYIKYMKKIIENGTAFIAQEESRLNKVLNEGKIKDKKKEELSERLNILKSFNTPTTKTEL